MQKTMKKLLAIIIAILMIVTTIPIAFAATDFEQQPTVQNGFTAKLSEPEADYQWYEALYTLTDANVESSSTADYNSDYGYWDISQGMATRVYIYVRLNAGDVIVFTDIDGRTEEYYITEGEETYTVVNSLAKTSTYTVKNDGVCKIGFYLYRGMFGASPTIIEIAKSVEGASTNTLTNYECGKEYYCITTYDDVLYRFDAVTGIHVFENGVCECGYVCSHNYTNHYCKLCGKVEDGYYAGTCGAEKAEDAIWSLDAEGTLTISGEGEYSVPFYDAPWKTYKENIKNVVIEEGITNIPWASFYDLVNAVSLSIPSTVASIDTYYNNGFAEIKVADGNNYYSVADGVLFNYNKTELIMYPANKAAETYTVPDGVTTLGSNSFGHVKNLKKVNISDDVTTIKDSCFEYSYVENINFGKNVEVIEFDAFADAGFKTVVLPEKLEEISQYLFYGCGLLENLVIGSKVTKIGNYTLDYCYELEAVHFTGTEEQWQAITKPDNSEDAINTIEVHFGALEEKGGIDATCGEAGHAAGLYCSECDAYITGEEFSATGEHDYVDSKCEACGYECDHAGQTGATCEICGSALHVCDFNVEFTYNYEEHWKVCSCGEISEEATHTYIDGACECGCECDHPGQTGATCEICGSVLHVCDFNVEFTYNYEEHWKVCSCGEISAETAHTYVDGVCECGYECDHAGQTGTCTICGKVLHVCDFSGEWQYDIENHWKECSCGEISEDAAHTYIDGACECGYECDHAGQTGTCTICGKLLHVCDFSGEWKYDSEKHWKDCSCGEISEEVAHTYIDGVCECGYVCSHNYTNHYCKACGKVEDGYYAGACGAEKAEDAIWSLDAEGTLTISGEGEYSVPFYDAPWLAYKESIKNVVIEEGITNIPWTSFYGLFNAVSLSIPSTVASIDPYYNNGFAEIKVADGNNYYSVIDGVLFNHDKTELIMYPVKKADETYTVPDGVKTLGKNAFNLLYNLKTINISDDVTTIKDSCFEYASVKSINFGKNVEVIESGAFAYVGLKTVVLPEKLTEIHDSVFWACDSLEILVIGSKVTSIDNDIISYCDNIETVHFTGTEEQWQAITKPDNSEDAINTIEIHFGALEEKDSIDATCAEAGHTAGLYCDECNAYLTGEEIPATGEHTYVDGKCDSCGADCPHENITDGKCDACGAEGKIITITMNDSYGDGWNGNAVVIERLIDGTYTEVATATIEEGKSGILTVILPEESSYTLKWIEGNYSYECNFTVFDDGETVFEGTDGSAFSDGEYFYLSCNHNYVDGKCDCGYECPHTETYETVTKPEHFSVQNPDGTWTKATISVVCRECESVIEYKEADRADYTEFDKYMARACEILETGNLIEKSYTQYSKIINNIKSHVPAMGSPFQSTPDSYIGTLEYIIEELEAGIADGTMKKADFTYMTALFDEVNAVINGDAGLIISNEVGKYWGPYYYYQSQLNNANHSQASYDENMKNNNFENNLAALAAGLKDGTMLKADYTAIDEAIAKLDEKLADENVTDEAKAELEEIKSQLEEKKADRNTSAADLAELEKALEDYETELDAGIEDGTAVKVNGLEEIVKINDKLNNELAEKYGEEALAEIAEKLDEKFADKFDELYERAEALTGSVAENKDALAEIEAEMEAIFAEAENCLNGTHNGLKFEVTEEAKCGENAIESATCTLCGETVTREVENSALTHSFTKYEVTEEAKCGVAGKKVAICDNGCGATDEKAIAALTHKDADGDYKCDNGCGHEFQKPAPEEPTDKACDHLCHKGGFVGFIWKIVQFFWKLFKMNPVCACGAAHY